MNLLMRLRPENPQDDYMFIGRSVDTGELHAGYLVVDRKWFVHIKNCDHYIYKNRYKEGGLSGGMLDVPGFEIIKVDPETVRPYDQIAQIMMAQEKNIDALIVKDAMAFPVDTEDNVIARIKPTDPIPYHLYPGSEKEV